LAIVDRVKYEGPASDDVLVWRWPSENLSLGTQVIVGPTQEAILVKGGQALDLFGPGTHTLVTDNIPLLARLVNLPFGGKTPFTAEVYFVNRHAKLDMKWGTRDPLYVEDPRYHVIVPVRSFGQMGIRVQDSRSFLNQIAGVVSGPPNEASSSSGQGRRSGQIQPSGPGWRSDRLSAYFEGLVVSAVKACVAEFIVSKGVSMVDITAKLGDISVILKNSLTGELARFGVELVNFYVMSVNVPDDDPSVRKIREIMATRAEFEQLGDAYRVKRTFDTLEKAAESDGVAGALLAGGLGLGAGLGAGPRIGVALGESLTSSFQGGQKPEAGVRLPEAPRDTRDRLARLKSLLDAGLISQSEYDEKKRQILEEL
jgi:membrane protease subunit (stomatin/prohibitin family)